MEYKEKIDYLKQKPKEFINTISDLIEHQEEDRKWTLYIAERNGEKGIGVLRHDEKAGEWFPSSGPIPGVLCTKDTRGRCFKKEMHFFKNCCSEYAALNLVFEKCMHTLHSVEFFWREEINASTKCRELEAKCLKLNVDLECERQKNEKSKGRCDALEFINNSLQKKLDNDEDFSIDSNDNITSESSEKSKTKMRDRKKSSTHKDVDGPGIPDNEADLKIEIDKFLKKL